MTDQNPTARRAALEAAVADRKQEADEVRRQVQANHERVNQIRDELAARPGDEFGPDGSARPKTAAARLYARQQAAEHPPVPWERRQQDAANRVTAAERALREFGAANVTELVKAREPEGTAIDKRILDTAAEFCDAVLDKNRFGHEMAQMIAPVQGLDAHTEIVNTDQLGQLRLALKKLIGEGVPSSMPRSICPPEGTLPPRVQTTGGWISTHQAEIGDEHRRRKQEEQEQRERKARRRVPVNPLQPSPSPHAERELHRRGWQPT